MLTILAALRTADGSPVPLLYPGVDESPNVVVARATSNQPMYTEYVPGLHESVEETCVVTAYQMVVERSVRGNLAVGSTIDVRWWGCKHVDGNVTKTYASYPYIPDLGDAVLVFLSDDPRWGLVPVSGWNFHENGAGFALSDTGRSIVRLGDAVYRLPSADSGPHGQLIAEALGGAVPIGLADVAAAVASSTTRQAAE